MTLPHNPAVEKHVLAVCLLDEGPTYQRALSEGVTDSSFFDPKNRIIWKTLSRLTSPALELLIPELGDHLETVGGTPYLMELSAGIGTTTHAGPMICRLKELEAKRGLIRRAQDLIEHAQNGTDFSELTEAAKALIPAPAARANPEACRVRFTAPPAQPTTRLFLAGKPVCTPGNLTTIISRAKTGKTATLGGAIAAIIAAHHDRPNLDTLGFTAPHTSEAVVLIDTEQSPYDAWTCHSRTLARAAESADPDWLCHYALVGYSPRRLRDCLPPILDRAKAKHQGIFTLVLDGVADFVTSVNDEAECNDFIAWLRTLSIAYDCPVICVIHSNEGVKNGDDGRGWLGKELTRKAESNLLLKKTGDTTTITSDKQRKAPITEADGIAFKWSDEHQRHVLSERVEAAKARGGRQRLHSIQEFIECIPAKGKPPLTASQLHRYAIGVKEIKLQTFKDLLADAVKDGTLTRTYDDKSGFSYSRAV